MNAWAEVDAWKANVAELAAEERRLELQMIEISCAERLHHKLWQNLKQRFRELPANIAEDCYRSARKWTRELKGLSPLSDAAQVANDWLLEQGLGPGMPARWRPMCEADRLMVVALGTVRMPPASGAKRLRASLLDQLSTLPEALITEPQAVTLRHLVTKFRRQIRAELLPPYARWLLNEPQKTTMERG